MERRTPWPRNPTLRRSHRNRLAQTNQHPSLQFLEEIGRRSEFEVVAGKAEMLPATLTLSNETLVSVFLF